MHSSATLNASSGCAPHELGNSRTETPTTEISSGVGGLFQFVFGGAPHTCAGADRYCSGGGCSGIKIPTTAHYKASHITHLLLNLSQLFFFTAIADNCGRQLRTCRLCTLCPRAASRPEQGACRRKHSRDKQALLQAARCICKIVSF
jgi:hypothetical protein